MVLAVAPDRRFELRSFGNDISRRASVERADSDDRVLMDVDFPGNHHLKGGNHLGADDNRVDAVMRTRPMAASGVDGQVKTVDVGRRILGSVLDYPHLGCVIDVEGEDGLGPDVGENAGFEHLGRPVTEFLRRLGDKEHGPRQFRPHLGQDMGHPEKHGRVDIVSAGVHEPNLPAVKKNIVVLVVAADDGVMPQTKEPISHARAANAPNIVAINKIDRPEANIDRVKQQLSKEGLLVEDWGGQTISVEVSAKEKTNLTDLLEMILLLADVIELRANPRVEAQGVVIEARLDSKKGPLATVIIQHGTLAPGQAFICGTTFGKVRALFDESGGQLKKADPSMPVEILGFSDVPLAGDLFQVVPDLETARTISASRQAKAKKKEPPRRSAGG